MKENSNPFQPALAQPADDSALNTDSAADNFTDDASAPIDNAKPPRPAVSLDGISRPSDSGDDTTSSDSTDTNDTNTAADSNSPTFGSDPLDGISISPDAIPSEPTSDPLSQIAALTDDDQPALPTDAKLPKDQKQPKQFTISILTIIFFVLTLAGAAGTGYFWWQNSENADARADAEAKVAQLTDQTVDTSTSENKATGQFDALQDRVADLTKQSEDKQKKLDENKKTIDDLNKKVTDLNKAKEDAEKKAADTSALVTRVDKMIQLLESGQSAP
ncbi:hypothetical protein FWG95_02825 [Candidatus Saccharibacteria bacterium]|nr:hypothetical protein [Candidatus Saccharibacteria bacterium]